ncbi:glycosyltransferase [Oceanospirillum sediminis]|uniref:Glycosyltransferase n=1 Tax=Oceanospirillum sediminis TaxID=2760088 RepID=A0A839IVT9_9GAMM|nr:glycosyltransferase [Oceanospirillum sediminis]MBB1488216.1 glycosyltransferase [Oceanospirillum sediminis]
MAPHPDDEVFGCGGALTQLVAAGAEVRVLVLTDHQKDTAICSESGDDAQAEPYHLLRRQESCQAAEVIGYESPEFLGLPDGSLLEQTGLEVRISAWLKAINPDLILAPSVWEMHRDHRAVAIAALQVMADMSDDCQLAMYEIGTPLKSNFLLNITPQAEVKEQAMSCFHSQLAQQNYSNQINGLNAYRTYSLPLSVKSVEAFFLLNKQQAGAIAAKNEARQENEVLLAAEQAVQQFQQDAIAADLRYQKLDEEFRLQADFVQRLENDIDGLKSDLQDAHQKLDHIYASKSWKVTRPLRTLSRYLRGQSSLRTLVFITARRLWKALPLPSVAKQAIRSLPSGLVQSVQREAYSTSNNVVAEAFLEQRQKFISSASPVDNIPLRYLRVIDDLPVIDLSVVTYNSSGLLETFISSLHRQNYPCDRLVLTFVDNGSTDNSIQVLESLRSSFGRFFAGFNILHRTNRGFGAGHNAGIAEGQADYVLVVNPDIEFEADTLTSLVTQAVQDDSDVACWEARQKPYEHPKRYDPVTLEAIWCSHACILLRRSAMAEIGGYDERIFLYGEDVEVSYRLREAGFRLKYVPASSVWHYTYDSAGEVKPAQYVGSILSNFYLRSRYGNKKDRALIFPLLAAILLRSPFRGSRRALLKGVYSRYLKHLPSLIADRKKQAYKGMLFPFRLMDYEQAREGAFVEALPLNKGDQQELPLVSIITRTVAGRDKLLRQAGYTVLNQTYPNIEWVVVEDGGQQQKNVVEAFMQADARIKIVYQGLEKAGRSAAGNQGMALASGEWMMFLDDDDCLYADHVETLMLQLLENPQASAAYSLAWEVESDIQQGGAVIKEGGYRQVAALRQSYDYALLRECNYIPIQAILFSAKLFHERGGFNTDIDYLEDWHLWQRYAYNQTFVYVAKTTSLYRTPMNSDERARRQKLLDDAYADVKQNAAQAIADIK